MKGRTWVLVILFFLVIIIGGYAVAIRYFHVDRRARDYIIERISAYVGGDFQASAVHLSPWSFGLRDAHLRLEDTPVSIEVKRIRIEFNIWSLLRNSFGFLYGTTHTPTEEQNHRGIKSIFLDEPRFRWILDDENGGEQPSAPPAGVQQYTRKGKFDFNGGDSGSPTIPEFSLNKLPRVRINIVNGAFILTGEDSTLVIADGINGWLDGYTSPVITLNMEGRILSEKANATCTGTYDRTRDRASIDIVSNTCDFSQHSIDLLSGDIHPETGILDFQLHFEKRGKIQTLSGIYSIERGSFLLKVGAYSRTPVQVSDVFISGRFNENEFLFDSVTGKVWNVSPELSGQLKLKPKPRLHLTVNADDINLDGILSDLFPGKKLYPNGVVNLSSIVEGPLNDLSVKMNISSGSLMYRNDGIHDAAVTMTIQGGDITFESFDALYRGFVLKGNGKTTKLFANSHSNGGEHNFNFSVSARNVSDPEKTYILSLNGGVRHHVHEYSADFNLRIPYASKDESGHTEPSLFDRVKGTVFLKNDTLTYDFGNAVMRLQGTASDVFDRFEKIKIDSELTLTRFPVIRVIRELAFDIKDIDCLVDGNGDIQGNLNRLSIAGDFRMQAGKNLSSLVSGEATVENVHKSSRTITVNSELIDHHLRYSHPMKWKLSVNSDSLVTSAEISDPDGAVMGISAVHETGKLAGYLTLDEFPLENIIDIFRREEFGEKGKLTGLVEIGGTVREPYFTSPEKIRITDWNLGGLNKLSGSAYVSGNPDELIFSDGNIERNGTHLASAEGKWHKGEPFVLTVSDKRMPLGAIGDVISKSRKCDGDADFSFTMVFHGKSGTIDGNFEVRDGHFLDVPFDRASGIFGGGSEGFRVTEFTVSKDGIFTGKGSASSGYLWKDATEAPGLRMYLFLQGDLLRVFPHVTGSLRKTSGESKLDLTLGGTWQDPVVLEGKLYVNGGIIEPAFLTPRISDVNAIVTIDPDFETASGMKAVRIRAASGTVNGKRLIVNNIHVGDDEWEEIRNPELLSVVHPGLNLDFGILTGRIDTSKEKDSSIELSIPGFMKPKDIGSFLFSEESKYPFVVGAADAGGYLTPYIFGDITVHSGDIAYPLLDVPSAKGNTDFLRNVFWNLKVRAGSNVNYVHEENITWGGLAGTTVSRAQVKLDESSVFTINGRLSDGSFRVTGNARSSAGTISYYGAEFDIERAELDLDTDNIDRPATVTTRARTVVYDDSSGVDTEIFLNVYSIDRISGQRREAPGRVEVRKNDYLAVNSGRTIDAGALGIIQIEFTSTNPSDDTQEKILARLGISPENIGDAATRAFASGFDNFYFNPWLRPFEDAIRRYAKLDVVRFTPSVLGNIVRSRLGFTNKFDPENEFILFDRSRIMLGKYVTDDWFLSYRGQYGIGRDFLRRKEKGFYHEIGLQYLLKWNTRLQFNYDYDEIISKGEKRFEIRHNFEF